MIFALVGFDEKAHDCSIAQTARHGEKETDVKKSDLIMVRSYSVETFKRGKWINAFLTRKIFNSASKAFKAARHLRDQSIFSIRVIQRKG